MSKFKLHIVQKEKKENKQDTVLKIGSNMADRALAHIEKVEWVKPIEGADNIELIGVLGWVCVAKKRGI